MKRILVSAAALLFALSALAKVELPNIIGDNMVLQRETSVALWGKAKAGAKLTIAPSWTKTKTTVTVGQDGKWSAKVATPAAGGPYDIIFNDGEKLAVKNVLIGEVWFCGGQSNMEMPVRGYTGQPVNGAFETIMDAKTSTPIRLCKIEKASKTKEQEEAVMSWSLHTPEAVAAFSATGYFFAQQLCKTLGVPVGVISCNWGGSSIETWIRRDYIEKDFSGEFNLDYFDAVEIPRNKQNQWPALLYNGMVAPIVPFTFKGIVWYQGETNRARAEQYLRLSKTYVEMMRSIFDNPGMPFYAVQIAPFRYNNPDDRLSGFLQEAQLKASQQIPHAGLATTLDIGNASCIHPAQKKEVGQRLAALALSNDYGFKGICARAPEYREMEIKGKQITLKFNLFNGDSIGPINRDLDGFEVAGEDKVFHKVSNVRVASNRKDIIIKCEEVEAPVAVRYAFHNVAEASFFNSMSIPVGPFRTDDWTE